MRKGKKHATLFSLFIAVVLIFSLSGQVFASSHHHSKNNGKGNDYNQRAQISLGFNDIFDTDWAIGHIGKMKSKNIFNGYEDGTFRPNQPVKKVEAIVTAVRLMGLDEVAKNKSLDTKLHFKDANLIDKHYKWAKGYIIVALEKGLFDITEDILQPEASASRVWAASLLVRALGLESEALKKMTVIPDFKDASSIPAGAIGYVNIAVERGIVSGYPDHTFQPNKKVTRAEMAAFLDRTNDGMQEELGAITVTGAIQSINFKKVTDASLDGTVVIKSFNNDTLGYAISSKLLVQYYNRFITADQLLVNDIVSFVVKDGIVIEANLLSEEDVKDTISGIRELKIKVDLGDKDDYKLKYTNKKGKIDANIEKKINKHKEEVTGKQAVATMEALVTKLALTPEMSEDEITKRVLQALQIGEKEYSKLEVDIKFSNGKTVKIDAKNKNVKDPNLAKGYLGIQEFELEITLFSGEKVDLEYRNKDGKAEAEVARRTQNGNEKYSDNRAVVELEKLIAQLSLSSDMTKEKMLTTVLTKLNLKEDSIKELELEVVFINDKKTTVSIESKSKRR